MNDDRGLIEDYLPIEAISKEASREKSVCRSEHAFVASRNQPTVPDLSRKTPDTILFVRQRRRVKRDGVWGLWEHEQKAKYADPLPFYDEVEE